MDTVIVGAGHAGLATSQQLTTRGIDYVGLPWLTRRGSSIISGIVGDAEMIGQRIEGRGRSAA